jgi:hypothetical protein
LLISRVGLLVTAARYAWRCFLTARAALQKLLLFVGLTRLSSTCCFYRVLVLVAFNMLCYELCLGVLWQDRSNAGGVDAEATYYTTMISWATHCQRLAVSSFFRVTNSIMQHEVVQDVLD